MAVKKDHALERLVFFSDAVFAIAITLLVIEIHAPHLDQGAADAAHWHALAQLIPSFIGYFVSFMVIGLFWMGHHRAFNLAARFHSGILWWNLLLLSVIAFMPFFTAYLSTNITARVPVMVYCGAMLAAALLNYRVNSTAIGPLMVDPDASPEEVSRVRKRGLGVILGAATAFVLAFPLPMFALMGLATIPLYQAILFRVGR
jgi:uncharacterized membrane protein